MDPPGGVNAIRTKSYSVCVYIYIAYFDIKKKPVDPPGGVKAIRTKADFDDLISSSGNTVFLFLFR